MKVAPENKKQIIEFGVSPKLYTLAKELAGEWGKPETEINREAWERGLRAMISEDNALGVHRKLARRPEKIRQAIEKAKAIGGLDEIIALLEESIG